MFQVVQQAQAQAHQQRQVVSGVPSSLTPSIAAPTTQGTIPQNVTVAVQQAPSTSLAPTPAQQTLLQQVPGQAQLQGQGQDQQGKSSPYAMRLRNQRQ